MYSTCRQKVMVELLQSPADYNSCLFRVCIPQLHFRVSHHLANVFSLCFSSVLCCGRKQVRENMWFFAVVLLMVL